MVISDLNEYAIWQGEDKHGNVNIEYDYYDHNRSMFRLWRGPRGGNGHFYYLGWRKDSWKGYILKDLKEEI